MYFQCFETSCFYLSKMALQVGGFNLPGLPRLPDEIPTKVLCLTEVPYVFSFLKRKNVNDV